ncbi:MAG: HEPN domain-containing protein [Candidatus Omnitrophica bacterium]|nr:HEPN domain-containing protein [Candidatus Omnitrophota bacterium]
MQKAILEWLEISAEDLQAAETMLAGGRYLYVIFMCQQAVEKMLKAVYVKNKKEVPPRTHNLLYLIDVLDIDVGGANRALLSELNQFYLESRYPGERMKLAKEVDKIRAQEVFLKTKGVLECLKQLLP